MQGPANTDPGFIDADEDDEIGENPHDQKAEYRELLDKVQAREDVFKKGWWKDATTALKLYDGGSTTTLDDDKAYNILYSNTEVLLPSLYSSTPKPDIRGRYLDDNIKPIPEVVERFLQVVSDPGSPGLESFDDALAETVLSSLVPGMGYSRLRHYPDRAMPLAVESGHFKSLIWGKARKWSKVPWVAFRHELTKVEFLSQFRIPEEDAGKLNIPAKDDDEATDYDTNDEAKPSGTIVYEIWVRATRKICFLSPDWEEIHIRTDEDTLKLAGFYPTPGPMLLTMQPGELKPVPLFQYYRNQAQELNRITVRLNKVISAIRVRGAYNGLLGDDMKKLLASDELENALVPASEAGILAAQGGGFDRHIWMLPIEKLIQVATQLFQAREAIKSVIYELTGISDIIRGSSVASETATAQDLKNKWGTVRLRKMQAIVANYVRDLYRLATDGATSVLAPGQWKAITQLPLPTQEEKQAAMAQIQQIQMQALQNVPPGAEPQPPQIPPQLASAAQQPSWEEVISKIKSDSNRVFLINVQNASTIDLDTAADKADVTEFMGALGQILPGLGQFVQLGPSGLQGAKAILLGICKRFKFGLDMVPAIEGIQAPEQPAQVDPEQQKQLEEAQKQIQEGQAQLAQEKETLTKLQTLVKDAQTQLQLKEATLKDEATRIEAARKVLDADQKVATISISADKKVLEASRQLAKAERTISDMQHKSEIEALIPEPEAKEPEAPEPVDLTPITEALKKTQDQIAELAKTVSEASKKPKKLVKTIDGAWMPEY